MLIDFTKRNVKCGYQFENNATIIEVKIPDDLLEEGFTYRLTFQVTRDFVYETQKLIPENGILTYNLNRSITTQPTVEMQINAYKLDGTLKKSPLVTLVIDKSVRGNYELFNTELVYELDWTQNAVKDKAYNNQTIDGETKTVNEWLRELKDNDKINPDWNENDEESPKYIDNRTHYAYNLTEYVNTSWDGDFLDDNAPEIIDTSIEDNEYTRIYKLTDNVDDFDVSKLTTYWSILDFSFRYNYWNLIKHLVIDILGMSEIEFDTNIAPMIDVNSFPKEHIEKGSEIGDAYIAPYGWDEGENLGLELINIFVVNVSGNYDPLDTGNATLYDVGIYAISHEVDLGDGEYTKFTPLYCNEYKQLEENYLPDSLYEKFDNIYKELISHAVINGTYNASTDTITLDKNANEIYNLFINNKFVFLVIKEWMNPQLVIFQSRTPITGTVREIKIQNLNRFITNNENKNIESTTYVIEDNIITSIENNTTENKAENEQTISDVTKTINQWLTDLKNNKADNRVIIDEISNTVEQWLNYLNQEVNNRILEPEHNGIEGQVLTIDNLNNRVWSTPQNVRVADDTDLIIREGSELPTVSSLNLGDTLRIDESPIEDFTSYNDYYVVEKKQDVTILMRHQNSNLGRLAIGSNDYAGSRWDTYLNSDSENDFLSRFKDYIIDVIEPTDIIYHKETLDQPPENITISRKAFIPTKYQLDDTMENIEGESSSYIPALRIAFPNKTDIYIRNKIIDMNETGDEFTRTIVKSTSSSSFYNMCWSINNDYWYLRTLPATGYAAVCISISNSALIDVEDSVNTLVGTRTITYDGEIDKLQDGDKYYKLKDQDAREIIAKKADNNQTINGTTQSVNNWLTMLNSKVPATIVITLDKDSWVSNEQEVTVAGMTSNALVFVSPASDNYSDYGSSEIRCIAQASDSLTFECTTEPTVDINVNIVVMEN